MNSTSEIKEINHKQMLSKPGLFFYQLIPDNSSPLYIDTNFGLLMAVQNIMNPFIKILSNCCGLALAAENSNRYSRCICVKCGTVFPARFNFLKDSPSLLGSTISTILPITTLNTADVQFYGTKISNQINLAINQRKRRPYDDWFNNVKQFNYIFDGEPKPK